MGATYELQLANPHGTPLRVLDHFATCTYARTLNDVGEMTLTVPANSYDPTLFQPDGRIYVNRGLPGQTPALDMDTCWFIRDLPQFPILDASGRELIQIDCQDAVCLLNTRIVPYQAGNTYTLKLAAGDDMMKAIVRENLGALATDTTRDLSAYLTVAADTSLGQIVKEAFAQQIVLDVCKTIANASWELGTYLAFDVVVTDPLTGKLEFRTYANQRGNDHRFPGGQPPVVLDPNRSNLADVTVGFSYKDEKTYAYAGGMGVGIARAIKPASDAVRIGRSPFNRREVWVDAGNTGDETAITNAAESALRKARPITSFAGTIIEQADTLRGVHWDFGDWLTANYKNMSFDVRVDKVAVTLQSTDQGIAETCQAFLRYDDGPHLS